MEPQKLLTVHEVAKILSTKVGTLYNWVHQKRIEHIKVGRLVRFEPEAIKRFIDENRVKPLSDGQGYGKRNKR